MGDGKAPNQRMLRATNKSPSAGFFLAIKRNYSNKANGFFFLFTSTHDLMNGAHPQEQKCSYKVCGCVCAVSIMLHIRFSTQARGFLTNKSISIYKYQSYSRSWKYSHTHKHRQEDTTLAWARELLLLWFGRADGVPNFHLMPSHNRIARTPQRSSHGNPQLGLKLCTFTFSIYKCTTPVHKWTLRQHTHTHTHRVWCAKPS